MGSMKLTLIDVSITYIFESDDGREYRTSGEGTYWEKRYYEGWEPVSNYQEETDCIREFRKFQMKSGRYNIQNEQS